MTLLGCRKILAQRENPRLVRQGTRAKRLKVETQTPAVLVVNILVVMTAAQNPGGQETRSQSTTKCTTTCKISEFIT